MRPGLLGEASAEVMNLNYTNGPDIPMGFGMALAQNLSAMNFFSSQPRERQEQIIGRTHAISSKEEMQAYVDSLIGGGA